MSAWRNPKYYITFLLISMVSIFLVLPLLSLFRFVFFDTQSRFIGIQNFQIIFQNPNIVKALTNSLFLSFWSATIAVLLSFFFAYGIFVLPKHFKMIFGFISSLFLLIPSIVIATILLYLFGKLGIFTKFFGVEIDIYGFKGILIAEILYIFPVLSLYFLLALQNMNLQLHQIAELFGANRIRRFFTITLPVLKGYFFSGFMIAYITAFTDFGIPKIIGGNYNVLATEIFKQVIGLQNINLGAVIAIFLIFPSLIFFVLNLLFNNSHSDKSTKKHLEISPYKPRDVFYFIYCGVISFVVMLLLSLMIFGSFAERWPYSAALSLKSYQFRIFGSSLYQILGFTIFTAILSALIGTVLAFLSAYFSIREQNFPRLRKLGYFFSILPNSIPGMVLGIAYIYFFNNPNNPLKFIYNTAWILIFANVIHYFAQPYITFANRFQSLNQDYENVQKIYAGSWVGFLIKIISPLSSREILYSLSYLFINSMLTISAVIFLYTPTTRLLSVLMVSKGDEGEFSVVFAIATIIFTINLLAKYGFSFFANYHLKKEGKEALLQEKKASELQSKGQEALQAATRVLQEENMTYWLDYATLLGFVREGNFIKGDTNINFGILGKDHLNKLLLSLKKAGFDHLEIISSDQNESYLKAIYHHVELEIYVYQEDSDGLTSLVYEDVGFIEKKFPPLELKEVTFKGTKQFIPKNNVEYLYIIYGADFMIPRS
ncbi:MAG: ABC transporter permease subunit [Brevinema sp.]